MTSRSYCFTINNYTIEELIQLEEIPCRYIIFGLEKVTTPHIQGYIEVDTPVRISSLKKHHCFARAHLEKRRGTREQARNYCMKDNEWLEFGNFESGGQGSRNDLREIMHIIADPNRNIKEIMEENPITYSKNMRFCEKYQALCERDETREFRQVETDIFIGDAGVGKSRKAREIAPTAFTVNPEDSFPFDGYDGEDTIIIDDFEGQLKYKHLLKILDGHQLRINVKGSHRYAKWTKVIITTNEQPEGWYTRGLTPALKRRLNRVTTFSHDEAGNTEPPQLTI